MNGIKLKNAYIAAYYTCRRCLNRYGLVKTSYLVGTHKELMSLGEILGT